MPDDRSFAARLVLIRHHMGWTNVNMAADACGISHETWRGWESGAKPRDLLAAVARIVDETGVDENWLLRGRTLPRLESNQQPFGYRAEPSTSRPDLRLVS